MIRPWKRLLWGVAIFSSRADRKPILLGSLWNKEPNPTPYLGEPPHPLLFCTRSHAREWCRLTHAGYAGRNDCCADWRFRPVRVRETVAVV